MPIERFNLFLDEMPMPFLKIQSNNHSTLGIQMNALDMMELRDILG